MANNEVEREKERHEAERQKQEIEKREADFAKQSQVLLEKEQELDFMSRNMFRIDRSTPTIEEMETTRSEKRIEQSKEYLELGQEVLEKVNMREITADEGRTMLDDKVVELKRYMTARYRRESRGKVGASRKKAERDYEKLKSKGWGKDAFIMDVVRDTAEVAGEMFSVVIPAHSEFVQRAEAIQRNILARQAKPLQRPQHYCMTSVELKGTRRFFTKTSLIPVLTPDGVPREDFMENLSKAVVANLNRAREYEEEDAEIECSLITMSYTISQWESIKNWYPENTPTQPTMQFKDFTVFLASNEEVNCEQQIVEYLGCGWDPSKPLKDMLLSQSSKIKRVLTYIPCQGDIRYVRQFSDLMTDYHEDVASTDCVSVARIIKWNDHMALITNIKRVHKRLRIQTRRPLSHAVGLLSTSHSSCVQDDKGFCMQNPCEVAGEGVEGKSPEIFVDIEAFQKDCEQVPYLVCWADGDEVCSVSGPDCVEEFVDSLLTKYKDVGAIMLYAWYGSGYDYQHIYRYLKAKCTYDECKLRNNAIIYAEFHYEPLNLVIHLKDPYLFILTSLDKAAKAFGVLNKGSFPHEIIKDWPDLDRVLSNWLVLRSETVETYNGKVALISTNTWEEIDEDPNLQTVLQRATEYCTVDVLAMQQVWYKFAVMVNQQLGMQIDSKIFTLSQLSMRLMEACLPRSVWLYVPSRPQYDFMRNAIYGGRVVSRNGDYREPILYADVVSLYPSAMRLEQHAYGKPKHVSPKDGSSQVNINWNVHGIYDVTLTHKDSSEPSDYMKFVPRRIEGKLHWNWFYQHRGTYHTYDLLIARDQGYQVLCHEGWEYPHKGYIFNEFIDKLYKLKDDHSKCTCGLSASEASSGQIAKNCAIRMVAKIALNGGGYGKFVQKPIDVDTFIVRRDVIAGECAKLEENVDGEVYFGGSLVKRPTFHRLDGEEYDKMIFEVEQDPYYATQVGISILSASRYRLYNLCKSLSTPSSCKRPGVCAECSSGTLCADGVVGKRMDVIYSDTDSIFVRKSTVDWELFKSKCGTELGQLDDTIDSMPHGVIHRMLIGGPKMYAYEHHDDAGLPHISLHCKGVPTSMLSLRQFEHLLDHKDNKLAYSFSIMRKRLVGVQRLGIIKEIVPT